MHFCCGVISVFLTAFVILIVIGIVVRWILEILVVIIYYLGINKKPLSSS